MKISTQNLLRLAGLCAVLAGICYVLVGLFHPPNLASSVTSTRWQVVHVLACAVSFFGLLGLTGLYLRQAVKSGWLGLVGYLLFGFWLVLIMGFSFVEAFVLPRIAHTTPAFVQSWVGMFTGPKGTFDLGVLATIWTLTAVQVVRRAGRLVCPDSGLGFHLPRPRMRRAATGGQLLGRTGAGEPLECRPIITLGVTPSQVQTQPAGRSGVGVRPASRAERHARAARSRVSAAPGPAA